jgi:DNA polymerase III epsilon subunit-like protein
LIFDTETTGLIDNRTVHIDKQPHIIEFCGQIVDLAKAKVLKKFSTLIKPSQLVDLSKPVKGKKSINDITGISNEMIADAPTFKEVKTDIVNLIASAPAAIAHNLSYDKDMVEIELERLKEKVSWPSRMICTVEQTVHLRGHRLNLTKLHGLLFPAETFVAHRAGSDVDALTKIAVELFARDII